MGTFRNAARWAVVAAIGTACLFSDAGYAEGEQVGNGNGRIWVIPSLSAKSIKNGDRTVIQAVVKAVDGVAKVEARIERDDESCVNPRPPVASLELKGPSMDFGEADAGTTVGLWQAEWEASGLEEGYYRVALTVTDSAGHQYTDRTLSFTDPIAGNNAIGTADYPDGGMRPLDVACLEGANDLWSAVIDTARGYAYFGTGTLPGRVMKVALGAGSEPPTRVGALILNWGENRLRCAVIDAANGYAYFGTYTNPGIVVKVALGEGSNLPTRVAAMPLSAGEYQLTSAVIDAVNQYAYFGTDTSPGIVVKLALGDGTATPTRVAALTLDKSESRLTSAVIDAVNGHAYFGTYTNPGRVVKVALGSGATAPARVGAVTLNKGESLLTSAVIDPANGYAYFGTGTRPGYVAKVALGSGTAAPTRVGAAKLRAHWDGLASAVIDPERGYAYFGTYTNPGLVVKVALGPGSAPPWRVDVKQLKSNEDKLYSAVIDPGRGYAYFGTGGFHNTVVKLALGPGSARPTRVGALPEDWSENRLASAVIDSTRGYAYFGTDTCPGIVVKVALGSGTTPPRRVGAVTLNAGEDRLWSAVIDARNGYAYFGTAFPGIVVKVALGSGDSPPTRVGAVTLDPGEELLHSAVVDSLHGYAYFGTDTYPGIVVKVALGPGAAVPTRIGAVTLNSGEGDLASAVIDPANGYAYFGTGTAPGIVVKIALGSGSTPPTRVGAVTLDSGEDYLRRAVIDTSSGYAYFGTSTTPGFVVKVALGSGAAAPTRVGAATLNSNEHAICGLIDASSGCAYFGGYSGGSSVIKVALGSGAAPPTRVGTLLLAAHHVFVSAFYSAVADMSSGYAHLGTSDHPGYVVRVALSQKGLLKATKFEMPEEGAATHVSLYSHAAAGSVRLAIYDNGTPPALVWQSRSIPNTTTDNWLTVPIPKGTPSSVMLPAGAYWLAWQTDTMTPVASYATGSPGDGLFVPMTYGAFPSRLDEGNSATPTLSDERWSEYLTYVTRPAAPSNPAANPVGTDAILWAWQDSSNQEAGFKVYDDAGAGPPASLRTVTGSNVQFWKHSGLEPNTQYAFQVCATNAAGDSALTPNCTAWTLARVPVAPVVGNPGVHTLDVTIGVGDGNPPDTTTYAIQIGSGTWLQADGTRGASAVFRPAAAWGTVTVSGLAAQWSYSFSAVARNGAGLNTLAGPRAYGLTLSEPLRIARDPRGAQVPAGTPYLARVVVAGGERPLTYQWIRNGTDLPGATQSVFAVASVQTVDTGSYACMVTDTSLDTATSAEAVLQVAEPIAIEAQPHPLSVAENQPATFTITTTGGIGPISYQWRKDGGDIAGATLDTYTIPNTVLLDAADYSCAATDENNDETVVSNAAHLTVTPGLPIAGALGLAVLAAACAAAALRRSRR